MDKEQLDRIEKKLDKLNRKLDTHIREIWSSLVGSEMCIRDSDYITQKALTWQAYVRF